MTNWADTCPVCLTLAWTKPIPCAERTQPSPSQYWLCPCSLALGSRQSQKQLPTGSPAIQPLAKGQNPAGHLLAGPLPILHAGILPTCRGHCLPGPCCAPSGRSLCAKLRGRCWALLRPQSLESGHSGEPLGLATGPADLGV